MTRINCVPPEELVDAHLIAEYRELPRVFALIRNSIGEYRKDIPKDYRMGTGHVLFFYDKAKWLVDRQKALIAEMQARGFKPNFTNVDELVIGFPSRVMKDWEPTERDRRINRERIRDRLSTMKRVVKTERKSAMHF